MSSPDPASTCPPGPGASPSLQGALYLFMARSVPQGEFDSVLEGVGIAGIALAGQGGVGSAETPTVGPSGSELWVSDTGATNHITGDPSNANDWVGNRPGTEKVLTRSGRRYGYVV